MNPLRTVLAFPLLALAAAVALAGPGRPQERRGYPYEGTRNSVTAYADIDIGCILSSWRIKGVLVCMTGAPPRPHACLWIENAYPSGLLEVVRQPYRSHVLELGLAMSPLRMIDPFELTSSKTSNAGAGDSLQFAEGHAANWVPQLGLGRTGLLAVPRAMPLARLAYASEIDPIWRSPFLELLSSPLDVLASARPCEKFPDTRFCAWTWGSYYPRVGFLTHPSEPMAAMMQALRAGKAGGDRAGRVTVIGGYDYEPRTGHYIQMLSPRRMARCVPIGSPFAAVSIERGGGSKHGAYLFMHYGIFEYCQGCLPVRLAAPRPPAR